MTERDLPLLVVVTGPPGSGKTTIAKAISREFQLPLIAKDDLKEALYDTLGTGDRDWSRRLGRAVFKLMLVLARRELEVGRSLILEANFVRGESERELAALPAHRLLQLRCFAPDEILLERYRTRDRHPGHLDEKRVEEVASAIRNGRHDPLALKGELIQIDTRLGVDTEAALAQVEACLTRAKDPIRRRAF